MRIPVATLIICAALAAPASAKLPAPSDEAKAKAAETAAKSAWTDKVGAYQLCQAMNRTAEYYRKAQKAAGTEAPAPVDTPPCTDPGPYAAPASAPPLESSGAHSPAATATSPPSSNKPAAEQAPATK